MKALKNYIKESLKEFSANHKTIAQELLTCILFDNKFNCGNDDFSLETIKRDYGKVIDEITKSEKDFRLIADLMLQSNEWIKSFKMQCETFKNFIEKYGFGNGRGYVFIHHDTAVGIINSTITHDWSIVNRVEKGYKKFGISKKDVYQKADIYAVSNQSNINQIPNDDILDEIIYWSNGVEDKQFIGISLKKLTREIKNPKIYNLKDIEEIANASELSLRFSPSDGAKFISPNEYKRGIVSGKFTFDIDWDEHLSTYNIDIRSTGGNVVMSLTKKGASAQQGNCTTIVKGLVGDRLMRIEDNHLTGEQINKMLNNLKDTFDSWELEGKFNVLSNQAIELIDFVYENEYNTEVNDTPSFKEALKWRNVIIKQIIYFDAICTLAMDEYINAKSQNIDIDKRTAMLMTMWEIVKYSKGINTKDDKKHLPYLMIG